MIGTPKDDRFNEDGTPKGTFLAAAEQILVPEEVEALSTTLDNPATYKWVTLETPEVVSEFEQRVSLAYGQAEELLLRKHHDYGPTNISRAPGGPLNGLRVRMWDKLARINNLIESGADPQNESLRDSFLDIANYGIIALLVLDGDWPE